MIRWTATKGEAVCPRCSCAATYTFPKRKLWQCKACKHQFLRDFWDDLRQPQAVDPGLLLAIAIFANGAKGHSALQLSRDLDVQ